MEDAAPVSPGKLISPAANKTKMNNGKSCKRMKDKEIEHAHPNQHVVSPKKKKHLHKQPAVNSLDVLVTAAAGAGQEVSMLFSKMADVMSEKAAADATQMKELQGISTETQNLQAYLKMKKNHLKNKLMVISDKL